MRTASDIARAALLAWTAATMAACLPDPRAASCQNHLECPPFAYCDGVLKRCRGYSSELGRCGDGTLDLGRGEQCDDGNPDDRDGCSASCAIETPASCGDGVIDYRSSEQCDDGQQCADGRGCLRNTECLGIGNGHCSQRDGDNCSAACQIEAPAGCGDGVLDLVAGERCDDGRQCENRRLCRDAAACDGIGTGSCAPRSGDGCSAACQIEPISMHCGDGVVDLSERCDNGRHCDDGRPCTADIECAGIGSAGCHLRNGDDCYSWAQPADQVCRCAQPCDCNFTCELSATTRLVAGEHGVAGFEDGVAAAAHIGQHGGPLVVHAGQLYLADSANNCIRSIEPKTGEVRTIAGGRAGERGYLDDASNGLGARFDLECGSSIYANGGLATDGHQLYVGDCGNHVLRAVDLEPPHGVRTIAGRFYRAWDDATFGQCAGQDAQLGLCYLDHGDPQQAEFAGLNGLAYERHRLYLVDIAYHTLRELDLTSGAVTTLVGQQGVSANEQDPSIVDGVGTAALLQEPRSVVGDGAGFVYIGERHSVRRVNLRTREARTLFSGWASQDGDIPDVGAIYPIALASDGTSMFFAEEIMRAVRQLHLPTGVVTTIVGRPAQGDCYANYIEGTGNAARLSCVSGLAFEPDSRTLFVVDHGNNVVRQIL